ncbi:527d8d77-a4a9-4c69-9b9f-50e02667cd75 [Thermothielavioides terrestris]|uniref:cellulase n=1 Tax=Thermothielavioides terrestris TaxID=2587410 RepID=A0A446BGB4_9PEZI|nr:527d8d77-a4a9-4c69-9b9f-50e02667cd75 [Thermothielavioides terrestris]
MKLPASTAAVCAAALLPGASATIYYAGVAQSGGEFGVWSATSTKGTGLPGRFGVDYQFISTAGVDTMTDQNKVNLHRVAFLLERMCPPSYGLGAKFNETHFDYYKQAIDYITKTKGAYAILDPHNYMRYNDPSSQPMSGSVIGNSSDPTAATTAQFGEFWGELARRFADNEKVIFGLMNEPHDMPSALLVANLQAAIDGIRKAGAKNLIIAPGNSWTGGHSWTQGGAEASSNWLQKLVDPAGNLAIDIHEYLDVDFSGSHAACQQDPATNLANVTAWLREHKLKAFITEFGGSNTTSCTTMLNGILDYMAQNDEYIGWTAWAAGPFWGSNSPCCTDSKQWGSLEPGSKAADGGPSLYDTVWLPVIQKKVPAKLQWRGMASVKGGRLEEKPQKH